MDKRRGGRGVGARQQQQGAGSVWCARLRACVLAGGGGVLLEQSKRNKARGKRSKR